MASRMRPEDAGPMGTPPTHEERQEARKVAQAQRASEIWAKWHVRQAQRARAAQQQVAYEAWAAWLEQQSA
jgi:hypothetical protein